jgi:HAMP domain-containing protein
MKIRLKFNLILLLVFAAGFITVAVVALRYVENAAIEDAQRAANVTLDATVLGAISPRTAAGLGSRLVELTVRDVSAGASASNSDHNLVERVKASASNQIAETVVAANGDKQYVVARAIHQADGRKLVRIVTVNLAPVSQGVKTALTTLLTAIAAVFFATFFALNVMLDRMIVRPIADMAKAADAVSVGDFSIAEFAALGKDEIGILGASFNRLRRSTEEAIKLLKQ